MKYFKGDKKRVSIVVFSLLIGSILLITCITYIVNTYPINIVGYASVSSCGNAVCESGESCEWNSVNKRVESCTSSGIANGGILLKGQSCLNCVLNGGLPVCGDGKCQTGEECEWNDSNNRAERCKANGALELTAIPNSGSCNSCKLSGVNSLIITPSSSKLSTPISNDYASSSIGSSSQTTLQNYELKIKNRKNGELLEGVKYKDSISNSLGILNVTAPINTTISLTKTLYLNKSVILGDNPYITVEMDWDIAKISDTIPKTQKILRVTYNPVEDGVSYAEKYFSNKWAYGRYGGTLASYENTMFNKITSSMEEVNKGAVDYQIVYSLNLKTVTPGIDNNSVNITDYSKCVWGNPNFNQSWCKTNVTDKVDHVRIINENEICQKASQYKVDEIWIMHVPGLILWETFMVTPNDGYWVNGPFYTIANCPKAMNVLNYTYERDDMPMHNYGHLTESALEYFTENWAVSEREKHLLKFYRPDKYNGLTESGSIHCGNDHYPHNTLVPYNYSTVTVAKSNCIDWNNFPKYTRAYETYGCAKWNCIDWNWQKLWLKSIPQRSGASYIQYSDGRTFMVMNNWWNYIRRPDIAIKYR